MSLILKTEEVYITYGFLYYGRHRFFNRFRIGIFRISIVNSKIMKKSLQA